MRTPSMGLLVGVRVFVKSRYSASLSCISLSNIFCIFSSTIGIKSLRRTAEADHADKVSETPAEQYGGAVKYFFSVVRSYERVAGMAEKSDPMPCVIVQLFRLVKEYQNGNGAVVFYAAADEGCSVFCAANSAGVDRMELLSEVFCIYRKGLSEFQGIRVARYAGGHAKIQLGHHRKKLGLTVRS